MAKTKIVIAVILKNQELFLSGGNVLSFIVPNSKDVRKDEKTLLKYRCYVCMYLPRYICMYICMLTNIALLVTRCAHKNI
jgi:hypothetical protein